ncbi:MAG: tRNA pseudouridine(38-40) synthase TruA [Woeseiaceae bacterium]|nr:tRNA pseudouridine(38-40) synthase TruA [Woeseiaceae bacterium]
MGIEYDGTAYSGWQRQQSGLGVQAVVEAALSAVADHPVEVTCAGRTDAGVHATGQVGHFDTTSERAGRGWLLGANSNLPDDVSVRWVRPVADDFHARFSARSRSYRYLVLNRLVRSALHRRRAWWVHQPLAAEAMHEAAQALAGEHDFSAFRAAGCQAGTPVREIHSIAVTRRGDWITLDVTANAFLQHMVRNIAGTLVAIGAGEQPVGWAADVLAGRDRTRGGVAAPPHGLTLVAVDYPPPFDLPGAPDDKIR